VLAERRDQRESIYTNDVRELSPTAYAERSARDHRANWHRRAEPVDVEASCASWAADWRGSRLRRNAHASSRWTNTDQSRHPLDGHNIMPRGAFSADDSGNAEAVRYSMLRQQAAKEGHGVYHSPADFIAPLHALEAHGDRTAAEKALRTALEKESVRMDYDRALAGTRFRRNWDDEGLWKKHHDAVFRDPHHPMHDAAHLSQRQFMFGTRFGQVDGGGYMDGDFSYLPTHLAFMDLDTNKDGKIDREEWIAKYGNDDEFDSFDLDGDGFIDVHEFKHVREWGKDAHQSKHYARKWGAALQPAGPAPMLHDADPLETLGNAAHAHRNDEYHHEEWRPSVTQRNYLQMLKDQEPKAEDAEKVKQPQVKLEPAPVQDPNVLVEHVDSQVIRVSSINSAAPR